ncbi:MAG: hypothetical protein F3745_02940 [Nitrospinae bacterium]|nr:hypothetical protein [Nitrospinota bacterium]
MAQEIDIDYNASVEDICIPSKWVEACVDSHVRLGFEPSGMKRAGLDVADEGEDENSLIMAHGSVVFSIQSWKEGTTTQTARKAYSECEDQGVQLINYDSIGVGAGVKGGLNDHISSKSNPIEIAGVNVGSTELPGFWCDEKRNKDMFMNLKAKLWWNIRERCKKTYENVTGKEDHPTDELISIPNNSKLIQQLSQPKRMYSETGKIQIEPKKSLKKRGIKSHNEADALVLCFHNETINESGVW